MYLYPAPAILHTKCAIADAEIAVMGSSNMDMRSFGLNYEISMMTGKGEVMDNRLMLLIAKGKVRKLHLKGTRWKRCCTCICQRGSCLKQSLNPLNAGLGTL